MELKASIIITSFLLLLLLNTPCFAREGLKLANVDSGIYDIDYRGPETHSNLPPPNRSIHKPAVSQETTMRPHRKYRGSRARNGGKGKKTRV